MDHKKKLKELDIEDALKYTQGIINVMHESLIILYDDFTIALASRYFYDAFQVKREDTEGESIFDLGNRQWDIPKLRKLLEEILPRTTSFDNFEIEHDFPHIGKRIMLLNACRIYLQNNNTKLIIITIKDITESKKIQELQAKVETLESQLKI